MISASRPNDGHVPGDARREDAAAVGPRVQRAKVAQPALEQVVEHLVVGRRSACTRVPSPRRTRRSRCTAVSKSAASICSSPTTRSNVRATTRVWCGARCSAKSTSTRSPTTSSRSGRGENSMCVRRTTSSSPLVGELDLRLRRRGRPDVAARWPLEAAHLEDVGEVCGHRERHGQPHGVRVVVLDADALEHLARDCPHAADVERLLRHGQLVVVVEVGVGQVRGRQVAALAGGREQHRVAARKLHAVVGQEPGVPVVQAQAELLAVVEVPLDVRVEEGLALLGGDDLAGEVSQELGDAFGDGPRLDLGRGVGGGGQRFHTFKVSSARACRMSGDPGPTAV